MAECDLTGCHGMARPVVCEGHTKAVRSTVSGFPTLYVRLHGALTPSPGQGEHVSGSRDPQAPLNIAVLSLMEDMASTTVYWANLAREHRGVGRMPGRRRDSVRLVYAVEALARHDEKVLDLSVAGEYVSVVARLQRRADVLLREDRLIHRLPAPCPACEMATLIRYDGDEWVLCASCGARWDELSYRRLVHVLAWQMQMEANHA